MTTEPQSSSSLPTQAVPILHSSPPSLGHKRSFNSMNSNAGQSSDAMEDNARSKSEPASDIQKQRSPTRASSVDTERPTSAQLVHGEGIVDLLEGNDDESEGESESDPAEKISGFDWVGLENRYHEEIRKCEQNEMQLMQEWESLMSFFKIWAESGKTHETNRTFSRLRTRMAHVQNSEQNLEEKRLHYIRVVEAFQSALKLLRGEFG